MRRTNKTILTFWTIVILLSSCCIGAKVDYLGNHLYLSEYDSFDRRILYQTERCAISGVEIVPMTVMAISHNHKWIIAKSGNKRKQTDYKYWVIKNDYKKSPDPDAIKKNTFQFENIKDSKVASFE